MLVKIPPYPKSLFGSLYNKYFSTKYIDALFNDEPARRLQKPFNLIGELLKYLSKIERDVFHGLYFAFNPRRVIVHNSDLWDLDTTLACIIYPSLVKYKQVTANVSISIIDLEDVPASMREAYEAGKLDMSDLFNYVLDEMIWTFGILSFNIKRYDSDGQGDTKLLTAEEYDYHEDRLDNGTRLFGKYFRSLWN